MRSSSAKCQAGDGGQNFIKLDPAGAGASCSVNFVQGGQRLYANVRDFKGPGMHSFSKKINIRRPRIIDLFFPTGARQWRAPVGEDRLDVAHLEIFIFFGKLCVPKMCLDEVHGVDLDDARQRTGFQQLLPIRNSD